MIEIYLDSVDFKQIQRFNACLPLKGVTTNPSILAKAGVGVESSLVQLSAILGKKARFHLQVVGLTLNEMLMEAKQLASLPYDMVVKIPATETGLTAIRLIKQENITVLATAIYSVQQGVLAAFAGADYLAPYVNRIDNIGGDGIMVVADLQQLIEQQQLPCTLLPASFKNTLQVTDILKLGVGAITLPPMVVDSMLAHPAIEPAIAQFSQDWNTAFGNRGLFGS